MSSWQDYLDRHRDRFVAELMEFLRIPSISSLSEHTEDVARAARWVAGRLTAAGVESVTVLPTDGHPVVYGDWQHAPGAPTILVYGHFDTQPADPLDLWDSPPFSPEIRHGNTYARGASDDKGNMLIPVLAVEAHLNSTGRLPVNVKFLFEGQEEIGSPQLADFVQAQRERLACDLVLSADGGQWRIDQPALVVGLRGLCAIQIDVTTATTDAHSGTYGGTVLNPAQALARILASLHHPDGRIAANGFYDTVPPPPAADREAIGQIPFDEEKFRATIGAGALFGETGYSTYERAWIRPSLEINGIWGGFQGEGIKTVLPASAHAKISCRLVPDQDPEVVLASLGSHVRQVAPPAVTVSVTPNPVRARPYRIPLDHPGNRAAARVHEELYGKPPYFVWMGGSIPVCDLFYRNLGAHTVNFAFGLEDENIHAPNEFFRLQSFHRGQTAYGRIFEELGKTGAGLR